MAAIGQNKELKVMVYYEDTDCSGATHHANYLKFFERGRDDFFGLDMVKKLYNDGMSLFVHRVYDFHIRGVSRHSDLLVVNTVLEEKSKLRFVFSQTARIKSKNGETGDVVANAKTEVGFADNNTQRFVRIPEYFA